ncbi:putative transcriptional regulator MerR family [Eubacterium sp. CAG:841]|mgnify:FL=1|nr:putative transcriptional regulator MerR family [Eubacterium sp. CAG:841]
MYQKSLYDITEVCKMLDTTSRTLRFYEEKGIIQSTTVGISSRRQYNEKQISRIKNVFVLRTLGLSVKAIVELQTKGIDLKDAVLSKRAEIYASIESRIREINLLNEALSTLESGKDIFAEDWHLSSVMNTEEKEIARICTDAILSGATDTLYEHLSPRLAEYMPRDVYILVRKDTLAPLGEYLSVDRTVADNSFSNKLYCFVRYSKLGLKITYVFHGGKIDGLWLGYYDLNSR